MNPWDGFLKVTDSRTGQEFLIFLWEQGLVDETFLIEPCNSADFFRLMRFSYGLPSSPSSWS